MTLGQGHEKVNQYISPDLYFLFPKIYGLVQLVSTWEAKVFAIAADAVEVEINWKHKVTETGMT